MKDRNLFTVVAMILMVAFLALPAFADAGPPGTTFPEQPGDNPATACAVVGEILLTGQAVQHASDVATAIVMGVYADACLE